MAVERVTDAGLEILDDGECVRLLGTTPVGRVAVCVGDAVAVLPVNYAMLGSEILFFTGPGLKLDAVLTARTVTFEADEIDAVARTGWSVLAVGSADLVDSWLRSRAEAVGLYPWAAGDRRHLVRIRPSFLSGRRVLV
jgi:nitroimidazol reductase NimA-like FMN-containing flavoprotein (pyridoxamine 5'-phosphate oxidase superfamily)